VVAAPILMGTQLSLFCQGGRITRGDPECEVVAHKKTKRFAFILFCFLKELLSKLKLF